VFLLQQGVVIGIFLLAYFFIITGKLDRSLIAFSMGLLAIFVKVADGLTISRMGDFVDFNTLGILLGMMILVGVLKSTGMFQYIAARIVRSSKGNMAVIYVLMIIAVAGLSSVLDNVTTILLFAPIVFLISDSIGFRPAPLMLSLIFASNIGGMATIIGDPPNILIGSAAKIGFLEFTSVMIAPSLIVLAISLIYFRFRYPQFSQVPTERLNALLSIDPSKAILDRPLFLKGSIAFGVVLAGFILHDTLDYEASLIALSGGVVMLFLSKGTFEHIAREIEWNTLFFFLGLFLLTGALKEVGVIDHIAQWIITFQSRPFLLIILIQWVSGILGGLIGAVPVVAVFIPIVQTIAPGFLHPQELWWALVLGANMGGNLTISGTAANIVGVGILESASKTRMPFSQFFRDGVVISLIGMGVASFYLGIRWFILIP